MNEQVMMIAERIKELREILEISAYDMSKKLQISLELYENYENGKTDIPIGALWKIASVLKVDPTVLLTGESPKMEEYTVVRKGRGIKIERFEGYDFSELAFNYKNRQMSPMVVNVAPIENKELLSHGGQEFNLVLKGVVKVIIGKKEFILNEGDSIYFNPLIPHSQTAVDENATFLTVINE